MKATEMRVPLGAVVTAWGLGLAVNLGGIAIALLSLSAMGLAIAFGKTSGPQPITCNAQWTPSSMTQPIIVS